MKNEKYSIFYGNKKIEFFIIRKNVKNINLSVNPDMRIVISANEDVPIDYIKKFVRKKAKWIIKNVDYFKNTLSYNDYEKRYVSGESFKYLGKQYRLKVFKGDSNFVKYFRGHIQLYVKNKDNISLKKNLIENWYKEKAKEKFKESFEKNYDIMKKHNIAKPSFKIRAMKARWGSCYSEKKQIILNLELIKAPKQCIDYVVLHELIHLKYKNHNSDFYNFLTALMPDWKKRKEILDKEVIRDL